MPENKYLGPQTLIPMEVNDNADFSAQAVFEGVETVFEVKKGADPATIDVDYTITGGVITFLKSAIYTVSMTNEAIISHPSNPARVDVEINAKVTGIDKNSLSNIFVYPNPFKDELYVSKPELVKSIQITNVTGQKIKEVIFDGKPISTKELTSGIYFITIESVTGEKVVHKVVK